MMALTANPQSPIKCDLHWRSEEETCTVVEYILAQAEEQPPLITWGEPRSTALNPDGTPGRLSGFQPLVLGSPGWSPELPLVEARLFWENASLHVISKEHGGCRWARLEEGPGIEFTRHESRVHALADRRRFGMEAEAFPASLLLIEYRSRGHRAGWRLTIQEPPND